MKKVILFTFLIIVFNVKLFCTSPLPGCECRDILVQMNTLTFQVFEGCSAFVEFKSGDCMGYCSVSIEKVTLSDPKYKDSIRLWKLMYLATKVILQDVAKKNNLFN